MSIFISLWKGKPLFSNLHNLDLGPNQRIVAEAMTGEGLYVQNAYSPARTLACGSVPHPVSASFPITRLDHRGSHTRVASKFLQISPHVNTAHFICRHELGEELTWMWLF